MNAPGRFAREWAIFNAEISSELQEAAVNRLETIELLAWLTTRETFLTRVHRTKRCYAPFARELEQPAESNVVLTIELTLTWEIKMPIILWLLGVPLIAIIVLMLLGVVNF
jgi:hypothetical protein